MTDKQKSHKKSHRKEKLPPDPELSSTENSVNLNSKETFQLKSKINDWLDCDDKIKDLSSRIKKYKDAKKEREALIIKMITKLGIGDGKMDICDKKGTTRSRVYKHKSVTKGAIKGDIIKKALMEAIRDEKKVNQLVKKIENKRPVTERFYLKRTKGTNEDL